MTEETYCAGGLMKRLAIRLSPQAVKSLVMRHCAELALSPTEKVGIGHCALYALLTITHAACCVVDCVTWLHPIPLATVSGGNNE